MTTLLTDDGFMYSVGDADYNGHGVELTKFTQINGLTRISRTWGTQKTTFVIINDLIYAWGWNLYGNYGNGSTTSSKTHIPVDPFSTQSSLVQTGYDNEKWPTDAAKEIYSDAGVFNQATFKSYIDTKKFPTDTIFSMTSAPTVSIPKGEIKCTVKTNKLYSAPDGVKSLNAASFDITLTGFKVLADSKITNIPLAVDTKYNLNNIVNAMKLNGTSDVNKSTFDDLFTTTDFPTDNKFTIVTDTDKILDGTTYTATLNASKAQVGGYEVPNQLYYITIEGLKPQPDSTVTVKTDANTKFNANNIVNAINEDGKGSVDKNNLDLICDYGNFPEGNTFTIKDDTVTGNTYNATISASKYYLAGNVMTGPKTFTIQITGLVPQPDSTVTVKDDAKNYFNINNIVKSINPNEDGDVNLINLKQIADIGNFPDDNIFTVSNDTLVGTTYNATLSASKYYLGGNVTLGPKTFTIQITGLTEVPDSDLKVKSDAKKYFNANNIVNAINPEGKGIVNFKNLESICNIGNFPTGNIFTVSGDTSVDGTYNATISASKYYLGGNEKTGPKTFAIQITGLAEVLDSTITVKADAKDKLNATNIVKAINPTGSGDVNLTNLLLIVNIGNFPVGNVFTISNDILIDDTYSATLNASKYFSSGNIIETGKTFAISITGLLPQADSSISTLSPSNLEFGAIKDTLNAGAISRGAVERIIVLANVPNLDTNMFEVVPGSLQVDDQNLTIKFSLKIKDYYLDGNYYSDWKTFDANVQFENHTWLIVGCSIGGIIFLILLTIFLIWLKRWLEVNNFRLWG